jgi:hypothetical protein
MEVFHLRYRATGVTLLRSLAEEIGELDVRHGNALKALRDVAPNVRCEAYMPEEATHVRKAKSFPIEINVYGTIQEMESVGSTLSNDRIFLQEPEPSLIKTVYRNPHVFSSQGGFETPFFRMYDIESREALQSKVDATIHAPTASLLDTDIQIDSRIRSKLRELVSAFLVLLPQPNLPAALAIRERLWPSCSSGNKKLLLMIGLHCGRRVREMAETCEIAPML